MLDQAFGLQKVTKLCYLPAYNEPGAGLAIVFNRDAWAELSPDLQIICEMAAQSVALETQAQFDFFNAQAMESLAADGVQFLQFSDEIVDGMRAAWLEVQDELTAASEDVARVRESYDTYLSQANAYAKAMTIPMLSGRG